MRPLSLRFLRTPAAAVRQGVFAPRTMARCNSTEAGVIHSYDEEVGRPTALPEFPDERLTYVDPKTGETHLTSSLKLYERTERPLPMNVELLHYAPIQHERTHNIKVCDLVLYSHALSQADFFADFVMRAGFYLKMPMKTIPLPKKLERITVATSPFAQTKSKQNYERVTHKRLVKIYDSDEAAVELLLGFLRKNELAGVAMKANLFVNEALEDFDIEAEVAKAKEAREKAEQKPAWKSRLQRRAVRRAAASKAAASKAA
ncbi:hypothetical protein BZA70DRAFT_273569 [Myxozyma melibiosi]|uniref:Small ribosomal subunit protein uS10 domain-containing protein n=1 Tax=Myxozyma melibiosi TaxID=54550 RepID=A0ABR1FEU5_9ASCO